MADRLAIDRSHLSRIEAGLAVPSAPLAKRLAEMFTELTRDQIIFPEEYAAAADLKPPPSLRAQEA